MMRHSVAVLLLSAAVMGAFGCASYSAPVMPPRGILYTKFRAPLSPSLAEDTPAGRHITRHGKSRVTYIWLPLYVFDVTSAFNDSKIGEIALENEIREVAYVDYEFYNLTPFFNRFTIHVYGN
jgi:hypothetical protein